MIRRQRISISLFCLFLFQFWLPALAMRVEVVQGNKARILLEGESASVGDQFFALEGGKKKAVLKITQVKGEKAMAVVTKGKAAAGQSLQLGRSSGGAVGESSSGGGPSKISGFRNWGVLGSYLMSKMDAKVVVDETSGETETAAMTGSSFGVVGFSDYGLSRNFVLRGGVGYEMFQTMGSISNTSACEGGDCNVNISYLSFYGQAKYIIMEKPSLWVGGGVGFLLAMSKSSSVLNESDISANQIYNFAIGADFAMGAKNFIPVVFEYNLFPASATVSANFMALRAGYGWNF